MRSRMLIALALFWLAAIVTVLAVGWRALRAELSGGMGFVVEGWGFVVLALVIAFIVFGWIIPLVAGLRERRREQSTNPQNNNSTNP
jgi:heme/copper-type cytochrome/quinol oxidase subunit 2